MSALLGADSILNRASWWLSSCSSCDEEWRGRWALSWWLWLWSGGWWLMRMRREMRGDRCDTAKKNRVKVRVTSNIDLRMTTPKMTITWSQWCSKKGQKRVWPHHDHFVRPSTKATMIVVQHARRKYNPTYTLFMCDFTMNIFLWPTFDRFPIRD